MRHAIQSYLQFLWQSKNQHGVHSPFVYELVTQCFYDRKKYPEYNLLDQARNELLSDDTVLTVSDLGAGSRVFSSEQRKVSKIAKHVGISKKRQRLLFRLAQYLQPGNILELGTSLGLATVALAAAKPDAPVITIEGCRETAARAQQLFDAHKLDSIRLYQQSFETFFEAHPIATYDLVYVDGHHSKKHTLQYFEWLLQHVSNESVLLFDDIYWSAEMTEAWRYICAHQRVTVSIDTFQWGLVFFRSEQKKEHFVIRL